MSMLSRSVASALSFAHLTSFGKGKSLGKRAEDDEEKKGKRADDDMDDDEDEGKRGRRAEADDDDDDDSKGKKGKRAEADPEDEDEDGDDESEGDDDKGKRGRRAKRAEDDEPEDDPDADEDDDKKSRKASAFRKGKKAERARWARVLQSKSAAGRVAMAAHLLSASSMSSAQIIDVLRDSPRQDGASAERSNRNPDLGASGAPNMSRATAIQSSWDRALKSVSGG